MPSERDLLELLRSIRHRLDANVSLDALATRAGWSPFHLHRAFRRMVGETPKQYTQRLRLEGAAGRLLASDDSVLTSRSRQDSRAMRSLCARFAATSAGRQRLSRDGAPGASPEVRARHRALTDTTGPCVGLFHISLNHSHPVPDILDAHPVDRTT